METQKKPSPKIAYHRPQVHDYGDVKIITMTTKNSGFVRDHRKWRTA